MFAGADGLPDARVRYVHTPSRANDGGHTPRAFGLSLSPEEWTVLGGVDNYYVPLFVESLLGVVEAEPGVAFVYWDFVLDRKGNDEYNQKVEAAMAAAAAAAAAGSLNGEAGGGAGGTGDGGELPKRVLPIVLGEVVAQLGFCGSDDLAAVAIAFIEEHGIEQGGGCEDAGCVRDALVGAMRNDLELARQQEQEQEQEPEPEPAGGRAGGGGGSGSGGASRDGGGSGAAAESWRMPGRYEGYVEAELRIGALDAGAFAFRTDLGHAVGFTRRHHSADWAFAEAVLAEAEARRLGTRHLHKTLYVHN